MSTASFVIYNGKPGNSDFRSCACRRRSAIRPAHPPGVVRVDEAGRHEDAVDGDYIGGSPRRGSVRDRVTARVQREKKSCRRCYGVWVTLNMASSQSTQASLT